MANMKYSVNVLCALVAAGIFAGCSTTHYKQSADTEVYNILAQKSPAVPGMVEDVDIEPAPAPELEGLPVNNEYRDFLGAEAPSEVGAYIISLERALEVAFKHNRDYQTQKERLYLQALALTLDRHEFAPIFSGSVSGEANFTGTDVSAQQFRSAVDTMTGSAGQVLQQYANVIDTSGAMTRGVAGGVDTVRDTSVTGTTSFGLDLLTKGGSRFAVDLTSSFMAFLTGGPESAISRLSGVFTKPLLRGAGKEVNAEFLTQSERDVLYQLRDFTRFRKTFAVRVASQYYGVLSSLDAAKNNYAGLQAFELSLARERAFQAEGLRTKAEVGRIEQNKLQRDRTWTASVIRYKQSLDNFKILLGFPTDAPIVLDRQELDQLSEEGIKVPTLSEDEAVRVALVTRLDLYTARDAVDDAQRKIVVAANRLKPDLDLVFTGNVDSRSDNRFANLNWEAADWSAGAFLDLPLDRKAERNSYVQTLISYEVAQRTASLAEDNVKLDVRDDYRALIQAQKDYDINLAGVSLNRDRVDEESLRAELGLGNTIDLVDAQNDYTNAQTGLTNAIVEHRIALLEFWRDIGILYIKENGSWEDISDV